MKKKKSAFTVQRMIILYTSIMFGMYSLNRIVDPDYFFHFFTGKYILDNKIIPKYDIFSWYPVSTRWYTPSWAFDVLSYLIKDIGIIILLSTLVTVLFLILTKMLFKEENKISILKLGILILVFSSMMGFLQHRPTIFSFLFFAITIYILYNFINSEKNSKLIYVLPIIQLLWVNFHGASSALMYMLILIILIINVLPSFMLGAIRHVRLSKYKVKTLIIILVLTLGASLINPNTYDFFGFVFSNFSSSELFSSITELQSPKFSTFFQIIFRLSPIFCIGLTLLLNKTKKIELFDLSLISIFILLYFNAVRFYPYLVISSIYFIGKYLETETFNLNLKKIAKWQILLINTIFISLITGTFIFANNENDKFKSTLNIEAYLSKGVMDKLIELNPKRLENHIDVGSQISYMFLKNNSDSKVFINGLAEIYVKEEMIEDHFALYGVQDVNNIVDKYKFDYILTDEQAPLYYFLHIQSDEYEIVFEDNRFVIFKVIRYGDLYEE